MPRAHVGREAAELLAERDRHGILQVRPPGLENAGELVALCLRAPRPGASPRRISSAPSARIARRVAVGNTSLVDCPMLT